ncbi:MAG: chemotaxis protein CheW [Planctomycetota bacterium]|nr:chemotaxis protein CheW [Planctomycetota bacterium]
MSAPSSRDAADRLLDREGPAHYLDAWRRSLRRPVYDADAGQWRAFGLFRIGEERFALETGIVREVHLPRAVRALPGRTNEVFRGLVSLRGQIHLAADLRALLGVSATEEAEDAKRTRMLVIRRGDATWAFAVDEVLDFRRVEVREVKPAQVTVSKSAVHFSHGMLDLEEGSTALLDAERVFDGLARSLA